MKVDQPLVVAAIQEKLMPHDETDYEERIRQLARDNHYRIRKNTSELKKLIGKPYKLIERCSGNVVHEARLEKIERILRDMSQKKTG